MAIVAISHPKSLIALSHGLRRLASRKDCKPRLWSLPHPVRILNPRPTLSQRRAVHWCSGMSAHLIKVTWQFCTVMCHIFSLLHECTFQWILMCSIFVINVQNNEPPEQLGCRQKHHTTKPTRIPCGRHGHSLWPLWFVAIMVYLVADMVMLCGR